VTADGCEAASAAIENRAAPAATSRRLLLLSICAAALALRLVVSARQPIDHNGAWHVFIERNLTREYHSLAHPPLFLLLLKACDAVRHSLLAFRTVPILAGVASVYLIGALVVRLGGSPAAAGIAASAAAFAQSFTMLAMEVQSYTLLVFLVLASLFFYLDIVRMDDPPPRRARVAFAALAVLALLSHYAAALYLAGCLCAPLLIAAAVPAYRRALSAALPGRWKADFATLAPILGVTLALRIWLLPGWTGPLNHLRPFYFHPGSEPVRVFVVRNLRNTVNLFSPVPFEHARIAVPVLAAFLAAVWWAPLRNPRRPAHEPRPLVPAAMLAVLLLIGIAFGVAGLYPFGGAMRQQCLLFVFAIPAGTLAFDRVMRTAVRARRRLLVAGGAAAIALNGFANRDDYFRPPQEAFVYKRGIFHRRLGSPPAKGDLHLDMVNLIGFMMEYYDWDWRFLGRVPSDAAVERYHLSKGRRSFEVVAHRRWWMLPFDNPDLYPELCRALGGEHGCAVAFSMNRNFYGPPWSPLPVEIRTALESNVPPLAAAAGLSVHRLSVDDDSVRLDFCVD
jgi:hypothetical protein